jgi:hypothetical protein
VIGRRQEPSELHKIAFGKEGSRKPKIKLTNINAAKAQYHLVARRTIEVCNDNLRSADEGVIKNLLTVITNRAKIRMGRMPGRQEKSISHILPIFPCSFAKLCGCCPLLPALTAPGWNCFFNKHFE